MTALAILLLLAHVCHSDSQTSFSFANTQTNNMVLQQAPLKAQIWGFSPIANDAVTVTLKNSNTATTIQSISTTAPSTNTVNGSYNIWLVSFEPVIGDFTHYTIEAYSNGTSKSIQISNILFGEVYFCSGQSNMAFTVGKAFNATEGARTAHYLPYIRTMTVAVDGAWTPRIQLHGTANKWILSNTSSNISAVCWFYGRSLFEYLESTPIGLIISADIGTKINCWMSVDAMSKCPMPNNIDAEKQKHRKYKLIMSVHNNRKTENYLNYNHIPKPNEVPNLLWNGMVYPFLRSTIKAVLWYQGEKDAKTETYQIYNCTFQEMINDWRQQWSLLSDTSSDFPFGFVQLSTWNDEPPLNKTCGDGICQTAIVRYAQTGDYGYIPNPKMKNVFMATAVDLGDATSPLNDIHPRYKQEVAQRLVNAAKNIIYGESGIYWLGPVAKSAKNIIIYNRNYVQINFANVDENGLLIKNYVGFELFAIDDKARNRNWIYLQPEITDIVTDGLFDLNILVPDNIKNVSMVRSNWYTAPCQPALGPYNCAIYDRKNQLPAIPFILNVS